MNGKARVRTREECVDLTADDDEVLEISTTPAPVDPQQQLHVKLAKIAERRARRELERGARLASNTAADAVVIDSDEHRPRKIARREGSSRVHQRPNSAGPSQRRSNAAPFHPPHAGPSRRPNNAPSPKSMIIEILSDDEPVAQNFMIVDKAEEQHDHLHGRNDSGNGRDHGRVDDSDDDIMIIETDLLPIVDPEPATTGGLPTPRQTPQAVPEEEEQVYRSDMNDLYEPTPLAKASSPVRETDPGPSSLQPRIATNSLITPESGAWTQGEMRHESTMVRPPWVLSRFSQLYGNLERKWQSVGSPGAINEIRQREGMIAIATSSSEGHSDAEAALNGVSPDRDAYNRGGAVAVFNGKQSLRIDLHQRKDKGDGPKYYNVNDVQFVPWLPDDSRLRLVSAGSDCTIQTVVLSVGDDEDEDDRVPVSEWEGTPVWIKMRKKMKEKSEDVSFRDYTDQNKEPSQLLFLPEPQNTVNVLAVTFTDGSVEMYKGLPSKKKGPLFKCEVGSKEPTALWGHGSSANSLFVSSTKWEDSDSAHVMLSVDGVTTVFALPEDGDNMALSPDGGTLAAFTALSPSRCRVHLLDARARSTKPLHSVNLEPFRHTHVLGMMSQPGEPCDCPAEVSAAAFSPDGVYLAVGRNDDTVHVYDVRMMRQDSGLGKVTRSPVQMYEHTGGDVQPRRAGRMGQCELSGITDLQWVEGNRRRPGLITGGDDGIVRLWDVQVNADGEKRQNGIALGEASYAISAMSLGARPDADHPLVFGDAGGTMHVFSRQPGGYLFDDMFL